MQVNELKRFMTTIVVRAVCSHDCPDTCAMVVTVQDGIATEVRGDPGHPAAAGVRCTKVSQESAALSDEANWQEMRGRICPHQSGQSDGIGCIAFFPLASH